MMMQLKENAKVDLVRQPKQDEIILQQYDMDKLDIQEVADIHKYLADSFPNNKIISLPLECQIGYFTKEQIREILSDLAKYLDEDNGI